MLNKLFFFILRITFAIAFNPFGVQYQRQHQQQEEQKAEDDEEEEEAEPREWNSSWCLFNFIFFWDFQSQMTFFFLFRWFENFFFFGFSFSRYWMAAVKAS